MIMSFEYTIDSNFLDVSSCDKIIEYYSDKLSESKVIGNSELRTSNDCYIDLLNIEDFAVKNIIFDLKDKISQISNLPIENQELLTLIKYSPGQEFKPHFDAFSKESEFYVESVLGGQRLKTFIICLRQCEVGGETSFDKSGISLRLNVGDCIYWNNVDSDLNIFDDSWHSGKPPLVGEKWILTVWIRENKYYPLDRNVAKQIIENYSKDFLINILKQL